MIYPPPIFLILPSYKGSAAEPLLTHFLSESKAKTASKNQDGYENRASEVEKAKQGEEALKVNVGEWRSFDENAPEIIFRVSRDGKILFVNRPVPGFTVE